MEFVINPASVADQAKLADFPKPTHGLVCVRSPRELFTIYNIKLSADFTKSDNFFKLPKIAALFLYSRKLSAL